jgi:hypothetical protein
MHTLTITGGFLVILFTSVLPAFTQDAGPASIPAKTFKDGTVIVETGRSEKGPWKAQNTRLIELLDGYIVQKPDPLAQAVNPEVYSLIDFFDNRRPPSAFSSPPRKN